jgi:hypothetical protein
VLALRKGVDAGGAAAHGGAPNAMAKKAG